MMTKFVYTKFLRGVVEITRRYGVAITDIRSTKHHTLHCQRGHRTFTLTVSGTPTHIDSALDEVERDLKRRLRKESRSA